MARPQVLVTGLPEVQRALKRMAPDVQKQFRGRLRAIAIVVAAGARSRASWSKRIPRAITPTATMKGAGVRVRAKIAPHGGIYERGASGRGGSSSFRHPLFGDREHWYGQATRPYLQPAVNARERYIRDEGLKAVEEAKREAGL